MNDPDQPGLRPLELKDLRDLSISDANELYWKGKRIEVGKRIDLTRGQTIGAFIVGAAAVFGALASGLNDGAEFVCKHGWHWACGEDPTAAAALKAKLGHTTPAARNVSP
jgi:hypothetical protein